MGPRAGGERGVIFNFLLGREKMGGGNTSSRHKDDGGMKARGCHVYTSVVITTAG